MICSLGSLLLKAQKGRYAIGAFNVFNLEFALGIVKGSEQERSPVILQLSPSIIDFFGMTTILSSCLDIAKYSTVPVCVHLDHGKSTEFVLKALQSGFSSVMFDGSMLPFQQNLEETCKLAKSAHTMNISIEAEIGKVGKEEDTMEKGNPIFQLTNLEEAVIFSKSTQIDALAISIGSIHGVTNPNIILNLDLLKSIREKVETPLVLHGSSGVMDDSIQKAIQYGITKINVATRIKKKVALSLENYYIHYGINGYININRISGLIVDAVQLETIDRIRLFGSSNTSH